MSDDDTHQVAAPPPPPPVVRRPRTEYFAEETFKNTNLTRDVHIGWGVCGGVAAVLFCMGMSAATQGKSWNVSFRWLQRRVGFQFGTLSYLITSSLMYYHDGDRWVTRDWDQMTARYRKPLHGVEASHSST